MTEKEYIEICILSQPKEMATKRIIQLLEQKDNKINKVIDKLKLFKNDLKAYEDVRNNHYVPIGAVGIRINELLKILEE